MTSPTIQAHDMLLQEANESSLLGPEPAPVMPTQLPLSEDIRRLQDAFRLMHIYYTPVVFSLGFLGNAFSVVVLAQRPLNRDSISIYLMAMCIAETLFLCNTFHEWLTDVTYFTLYHIGGWCQFTTLVRHVSDFLIMWYFVSFGADRYLAWCCPRYATTWCKVSRSRLVVISIAIIAVVVYVNISLMAGLMDVGTSKPYCFFLPGFTSAYKKLDLGDVFINSLLPFCCSVTLFGLTAYARYTKCMSLPCPQDGPPDVTEQATVEDPGPRAPQIALWVTLHVAYFLFMCPEEALRLYDVTQGYSLSQPSQLELFLWRKIFLLVKQTKYTINIFLFLASYHDFRDSSWDFIVCVFCCSCQKEAEDQSIIEPNVMHKESQTDD